MKRKVIKQGKSTLTISLPAKFVQKFGISEGDEIDIEEREGELVINPRSTPKKVTVELDVSDFSETLFWRCLNALYIKGVNEIIITYGDSAQLEWIHDEPNRLIGFAITKEEGNTCVLKEVTEAKEAEFEVMLRHLFFTLKIMSRDTLNGLKNNSAKLLEGVKHREIDLNRIVRFCLRILNKTGYKNYASTIPIYNIIVHLENIGDSFMRIAQEVNSESKISEEYIQALQRIDKLIENFYFAFFKNDIEKIKELYAQNKQIREGIKRIRTKTKEETFLSDELTKITDIFSEVVESELMLLL